MGRYYSDAKTTFEQATQLSIFQLKEFGLLNGNLLSISCSAKPLIVEIASFY